MHLLAFDTSAAHCAAVLVSDDGSVLAARVEAMARGQAERLVPMLGEVLAEAGVDWSGLSAVACGTGPGNFTGIRVSVAAARGLALALGVPAVGVSGFEIAAADAPRPCRAIVPAPRGEVYAQVFDTGGPGPAELREEEGLPPDPPLARLDRLDPGALVLTLARLALGRWQDAPTRPAPLYVRGPDAAPPREAPPAILP